VEEASPAERDGQGGGDAEAEDGSNLLQVEQVELYDGELGLEPGQPSTVSGVVVLNEHRELVLVR
jgi:hypothetical protein